MLGQTERVKQVFVDQKSAEGQPAAQRLAKQEHVRLHAAFLERKPVTRSAQAALDLVKNQQGSVFVR